METTKKTWETPSIVNLSLGSTAGGYGLSLYPSEGKIFIATMPAMCTAGPRSTFIMRYGTSVYVTTISY